MRSQAAGFAFVLLIAGAPIVRAGTISGTVTAKGMRTNAGAVVHIEKTEGMSFEIPTEHIIMDQKGKEFVPRVLPVLAGTTVDFLNSDPFSHNVFTPDKCADEFDLGSWPTGETRSHTFDESCGVVILCNVHPEMLAYIVVVDTPYFAVTSDDGSYSIPGVPPGEYTVSAWHERLKASSQEVKVEDEVTLDFILTR